MPHAFDLAFDRIVGQGDADRQSAIRRLKGAGRMTAALFRREFVALARKAANGKTVDASRGTSVDLGSLGAVIEAA